MKKILYIGNKLSQKGKTDSTIDTLGKGLEELGFQVVYASSYKSILLRFIDMIWAVFKYRKTTDYVLIDTYSTLNFYYAFAVSQLCRLFHLKYIPILHGGSLPTRLKTSPKLSKAVFNYSYKNVAPSLYLKSHFETNGYTNILFIPNAIALKTYQFQTKNYDTVKMLWVRSFSVIYNPSLAVKILKALKDENIKAELCMIGPEKDGSMKTVKSLAQKLQVEVEFPGRLTKKQWHKKAQDFNIFINTTNIDNTPVSVIEAMALGLPVISTHVGGMPFLIKNNIDGVLVKANSVDAFVLAIKKMMINKDNTYKIANNAKRRAEDYDWDKVRLKWCNLLR
ncbi:glycosyltransferase family 4 protein [Algibacter pacificus]|uniref:glycosyltransferase family 4 protein n=1 Tax=Algibacter pacificus TaxID=2599389 RepID=UPI0011C8E944|nr:glycosyltransferase family 4 protein [Algibacter pacificus]